MILQALVGFYEQLAKEHPEKIARVGWCSRQVAFMLVLSSEGELVNVIPSDEKRGWTMMVPEQVKRTVGGSEPVMRQRDLSAWHRCEGQARTRSAVLRSCEGAASRVLAGGWFSVCSGDPPFLRNVEP